MTGEWSPESSGTGHLGTPQFREDGVTYYIVTSGENNNLLTIVSSYISSNGTQVFSIVNQRATYNSSIPESTGDSYGTTPDFQLAIYQLLLKHYLTQILI